MKKHKKEVDSQKIAEVIVQGIQEKKGKDIVSLDLRKISSSVSDYFIICHADSSTQVRAIADSVEHEMDKVLNEHLWHKEGQGNAEWILLDYVSV
ncbi:MAG: ribosome silencing factor, partial [Bacteroidota bacterium]